MILQLIGAVALWAAPAQGTPALTCIYDALSPADRKLLIEARLANATAEQKAGAQAASIAAMGKCGMASWSPQRQQLGNAYTMARLQLDFQMTLPVFSDNAVRPEMFHRVVAALPDNQRYAIATNAVPDALHAELMKKLHAQGMKDDQTVHGFASHALRHAVMIAQAEVAWKTAP